MKNIFLLGIGGAIGAILRYILSGLVHKLTNINFPHGTFLVNILGCFLIGFLTTIAEEKSVISDNIKILLIVGLLGAFTTFSTFSHESFTLLRQGEVIKVILYAGLSLILGLSMVWAGHSLAKVF